METVYTTSHNLEESVQDRPVLILTPQSATFVTVETSAPGPGDVYPEWYNDWKIVWNVEEGYDLEDVKFADYHAVWFGDEPTFGTWYNAGEVYKATNGAYELQDVWLSYVGTGVWAERANHSLG